MTFINFNLSNVNSLECVSINNQVCKLRSEIISVNTNEPMLYPYSTKINKCKGSSNTINDLYAKSTKINKCKGSSNTINDLNAKICVPDTIKNINVKVFKNQ